MRKLFKLNCIICKDDFKAFDNHIKKHGLSRKEYYMLETSLTEVPKCNLCDKDAKFLL